MFSPKHIQQAIHLADEALIELNKAEHADQAYTVDCYLSALDYLIAALPNNSTLSDFPGSVHRQALLNSKLSTLLGRTENPFEPEPVAAPPLPASTWLSLLPRPFSLARFKPEPEPVPALYTPSSQWTAQCQCGRHVSLQLAHEAPCAGADPEPILWPETIVSLMVSLALSLKNSPIPSMIYFFVTSFISTLIYLEAAFQIQQRTLNALAAMVRRMVELDAELGIVQAIANFVSWLFESFFRAAVAFTQAATSTAVPQTYHPVKRQPSGVRHWPGSARPEGRPAVEASPRRAPAPPLYRTPSHSPSIRARPLSSSRSSPRFNNVAPNFRRSQSGASFFTPKGRSPTNESQGSSRRCSHAAPAYSTFVEEEVEVEDIKPTGDEVFEKEPAWNSLDSSVREWAKSTAGRFGYRLPLSTPLYSN